MNIYKLAQIVKNLAENGFEDEANNLVDAIEQTPDYSYFSLNENPN